MRCFASLWFLIGVVSWASPLRAEILPARESAAGYYNIANAYARAGKPGLAVVNYERARLLMPNDPDVEANLRLVRESAHVSAVSESSFERPARWASPYLLTWLGLFGLALAGASALVGFFRPLSFKVRIAGGIVGLTLVIATVANAMALWPTLHEAVVIADATPVRVTPVPMGDQAFTLPEAEAVTVTAQHEEFALIRTHAGRTGWVSRNSLAWVVTSYAGAK